MKIQICPNCGIRVVLTSDGICPSCRRSVNAHLKAETAAGPLSPEIIAVVTDNPYQSPGSALPRADIKNGRDGSAKIRVKAVLIGTLVDIVGSTVVGFILGAILAFPLAAQGVPQA